MKIVSFHHIPKRLSENARRFSHGFLQYQDRTEDPIDTPPNGPAGPAVTTPAPVAPNGTAPCGGSERVTPNGGDGGDGKCEWVDHDLSKFKSDLICFNDFNSDSIVI